MKKFDELNCGDNGKNGKTQILDTENKTNGGLSNVFEMLELEAAEEGIEASAREFE
jgi:hypothetical protein